MRLYVEENIWVTLTCLLPATTVVVKGTERGNSNFDM